MARFTEQPVIGVAFAAEEFFVPADRITCRALFRGMSPRIQLDINLSDVLPAITFTDRLVLAERFETYVFSDEAPSLQRAQWIALERGVAAATWKYVGWANLAREIALEEVYLRTGSAAASLSVLEQSLDRFESCDGVRSVVFGIVRLSSPESQGLSGQSCCGLQTPSLKGSQHDGASVEGSGAERSRDIVFHSESSGDCVAASTVGQSGRISNDPAADTERFSPTGPVP